MLGEYCTHGHLCGTTLERGQAQRRRRLARGRDGSTRRARWLARGAIAAAVMSAGAGCAVLDPNLTRAWKVEPLLQVKHALQSSESYYTLGRYHDGSRNWEQSVAAYRKAVALDAMHIEAYNALGVALARLERFGEAETTLRQAVAIAPTLAHLRSNLGYTLLLAGKVHDAVTELQAAVMQDRADGVAVANLRQALASWEAMRAAPGAPDGSVMTARLHGLEGTLPARASALEPTAPEAPPARSGAPLAQPDAGKIDVASPIVSAMVPTPILVAEVPVPMTATGQPSPHASVQPPSRADVAAPPVPSMPTLSQTVTAVGIASRHEAQPVTLAQLPALAAVAQAALALRVVDGPTIGSLQRPGDVAGEPRATNEMRPTLSPASPAAANYPGVSTDNAPAPAADQRAQASRAVARTVRPAAQLLPEATVEAIVARLEVSNGNGVTGMAARIGHWLAAQGVKPTVRLTNQRPFQQGETIIQYRRGHEAAARLVARLLPAEAQTAALPSSSLGSDVRVLIGRDWIEDAACLSDNSCKPVWAQRRDAEALLRAGREEDPATVIR